MAPEVVHNAIQDKSLSIDYYNENKTDPGESHNYKIKVIKN